MERRHFDVTGSGRCSCWTIAPGEGPFLYYSGRFYNPSSSELKLVVQLAQEHADDEQASDDLQDPLVDHRNVGQPFPSWGKRALANHSPLKSISPKPTPDSGTQKAGHLDPAIRVTPARLLSTLRLPLSRAAPD